MVGGIRQRKGLAEGPRPILACNASCAASGIVIKNRVIPTCVTCTGLPLAISVNHKEVLLSATAASGVSS
jgi:hypothetical protein